MGEEEGYMYTLTITMIDSRGLKYTAEKYGATSVREEEERLIVVFAQKPPEELDGWLRSLMWNHRIREYSMQYEGA
jgi:hypothetical protein